ncbi:hypothetical protein LR010_00025, partial [Candidatus Gracilibacteria bacterium]|nr:hypothetical protein [Candidatus Gracilibacteria bacterium]
MNIFTYRNLATAKIFTVLVAVSMILSALPAHIFVADAAAGDVVRLSDGALFADLQAAHDDAGTSAGETLTLTADVTTSEQVTITKGIILDGSGYTLSSDFARPALPGGYSNNSAIGVQTNDVTIENLTIDGSGGTKLHGVNVYQSTGVVLDTLSFIDINHSAVVVNASNVTVNNISTSNSGTEGPVWKVIDVDPKSTTASLIVNGISAHDEVLPRPHIWAQNPNNVTITDTNNQYNMVSFLIFGGDRYRLRPPATIIATKIVCDDESMLPNWGNGAAGITSTTADDFLAANTSCRAEDGWEFQWAPQGSFDPGDVLEGEADDPWTTFGPTDVNGMTTLTLTGDQIDGDSEIKIREVLQDGYIPFTHDQNGNTNEDDISAEIYCHTDV